ncbi:MAG: GIY-YIG nuclease family protein [Chthoniobacterales bacterium]|nr:GIY-YIG nuclease family protein [Chthoniobacterales bacterium]
MNYFVYAIQSQCGRVYVGQTDDFEQRLSQHNKGQVKSTREDRPWHLLKIEAFPSREGARYFEWQLKKSRGRRSRWLQQ